MNFALDDFAAATSAFYVLSVTTCLLHHYFPVSANELVPWLAANVGPLAHFFPPSVHSHLLEHIVTGHSPTHIPLRS